MYVCVSGMLLVALECPTTFSDGGAKVSGGAKADDAGASTRVMAL